MIDEWKSRGFKNTMEKHDIKDDVSVKYPWWFTCKQLQLTHKCSLYRKDTKYYKEFKSEDNFKEFLYRGYLWLTEGRLTDKDVELLKQGKLNIDLCDPLGAGVPARWRISKEDCVKWNGNRLVNPKTNRKIKEGGKIYKDYKEAYGYHVKDK